MKHILFFLNSFSIYIKTMAVNAKDSTLIKFILLII